MLTRKTATETAAKHLTELIPLAGIPVLEEYFYADGVWQITLGYMAAVPHASNGVAPVKEYKAFAIDGRSGEILSMKIRTLKA
jgi:hypothetical protein